MRIRRKHRYKKRGWPGFFCVVVGDTMYTDVKKYSNAEDFLPFIKKTGKYRLIFGSCGGVYVHHYKKDAIIAIDIQGRRRSVHRITSSFFHAPIGFILGHRIWPIYDLHELIKFDKKAEFHAC